MAISTGTQTRQSDNRYIRNAMKANMDGLTELAGIYQSAMKDCFEPFAGYAKEAMSETKTAASKAKAS